jgi:membrane-bound lytic murein transglycosylase B
MAFRVLLTLCMCAPLALVLGMAGPAHAQSDERLPVVAATEPATASIAPAGNGSGGSTREWSGSDGGSGHPTMTADAIRAAAANFGVCIESLWPDAARRGISRGNFDQHTAGLTPDLRIMDLMDSQPEFTKAFWDYLDILVTEARIQKGREILARYKDIFDTVEAQTGVDRYAVAAIWGVESNYGTAIGERPVVRSTATLACIGRRQNYFREEFLSTLEILHHGHVTPDQLKGSWAGAFGPTQFMPTAFKRYAVDFDGDGRRDVVGSMPDVIASTANNLKKDGWIAGETWGYEVVVPEEFNYLQADRSKQHPISHWEKLGLKRPDGKPFPRPNDRAYLLVPAGARGPGFLMLHNFRVIMKYNPAEAYAMAIGHLADRVRGGSPIIQPWPRDERVLSRSERYELQQRLASKGFDIGGEADGRLGAKTRAAVRDYQMRARLVPDGFASTALLEHLRSQ